MVSLRNSGANREFCFEFPRASGFLRGEEFVTFRCFTVRYSSVYGFISALFSRDAYIYCLIGRLGVGVCGPLMYSLDFSVARLVWGFACCIRLCFECSSVFLWAVGFYQDLGI